VAKSELVVLAELHAPEAREIGRGLLVGGPVVGSVLLLVVDPTHGVAAVQEIVGVRLVG
jgi:hypothetical protein